MAVTAYGSAFAMIKFWASETYRHGLLVGKFTVEPIFRQLTPICSIR